jgi:TRAP-type C4-dicarboxylate transport system permease small subunit
MIDWIEKLSLKWNRVLVIIASVFILSTMFLVAADVSGRFFFGRPITSAIEIGQIMLAYIAFLSLSYGLIKRTHVRVTLLFDRFPQKVRHFAEILSAIAGIAFFSLLLWGGTEQFWDSWIIKEIMPAAARLPYWFPKLAFPIGAALMIIQLLIYLLRPISVLFFKRGE